MIIDTESPEGRALVALAMVGHRFLHCRSQCYDDDDTVAFTRSEAIRSGCMSPYGGKQTDLAKLPEGL